MRHSEKYIITHVIILKSSEIKHVSFENATNIQGNKRLDTSKMLLSPPPVA